MWYQLQLEVCMRNEVDALSEALELSEALSITLSDKNDNPVLEPAPGTTPLWPDVIITALYTDENIANKAKTAILACYPHLIGSIVPLPDEDWERVWMVDYKPIKFGDRIWVCPSWITPPEPNAVNLILDPGLAFGTGTHATTALCLNWLGCENLTNQKVIDYGCGSGILALAALKLGAQFVQAIDIDPQALIATNDNAKINDITSNQLQIGTPELLQDKASLILANILLAPLLQLNKKFKNLLQSSGRLVVSGLLSEQAQILINAYKNDFVHQKTEISDGWALIVFTVC